MFFPLCTTTASSSALIPSPNTRVYFPTQILAASWNFPAERQPSPLEDRTHLFLCIRCLDTHVALDPLPLYTRKRIAVRSKVFYLTPPAFSKGNWPWSAVAAAETWQVLGIRVDWGLWWSRFKRIWVRNSTSTTHCVSLNKFLQDLSFTHL